MSCLWDISYNFITPHRKFDISPLSTEFLYHHHYYYYTYDRNKKKKNSKGKQKQKI